MRVHDADLGTGALQCFLLAAMAWPALEDGSLFRTPQIHCPISTSRSRSTPVLMPRPCSMYTTSSVATLPGARGVRTAAEPGDRGVERSHAELERGVDIGERLAIGVVVMACQPLERHAASAGLDHRLSLPGRADADGVAERDFVAAHPE